jgi:hypothetical protein
MIAGIAIQVFIITQKENVMRLLSSRSAVLLGVVVSTLATMALPGCAPKPEIVPATSHPMSDWKTVKILEKEPKKYEILATLTSAVTDKDKWDEQGNADAAFDVLLKAAATKGANALLLKADEANGEVLAGYHGTFYKVPIHREEGKRSVITKAIFVVEE